MGDHVQVASVFKAGERRPSKSPCPPLCPPGWLRFPCSAVSNRRCLASGFALLSGSLAWRSPQPRGAAAGAPLPRYLEDAQAAQPGGGPGAFEHGLGSQNIHVVSLRQLAVSELYVVYIPGYMHLQDLGAGKPGVVVSGPGTLSSLQELQIHPFALLALGR